MGLMTKDMSSLLHTELNSFTSAPGYDAMKEDPDIYKTTDFCGHSAPRHFPEMALPIPGVPAQQQQQPSSSGRSPAPVQGPVVPDQLIEVMQNTCMMNRSGF